MTNLQRCLPKVDTNRTCLVAVSLDSVLKKNDNDYPQVFLKSVNVFRKKEATHVIEGLKSSSDDSGNSDYSNE